MSFELLTSEIARERAERASRALLLAREVADTGRCLYAASSDEEVAFITSARMRYLDFRYFLDEQWRLTGERLRARALPVGERGDS